MSGPGLYLVNGSDPTLRGEAVRALLDEILAGDDPAFAVETFTVPDAKSAGGPVDPDGDAPPPAAAADGDVDPKLAVVHAACDAALSAPFLTEFRVVVVDNIGALARKDQYAPLVEYLGAPSPTTALVLVTGGGTAPKPLLDAMKAAGAATHGPESETTPDVIASHVRDSHLQLTPGAKKLLGSHLGDDAGRVPAMLAVLESAFGANRPISATDIEPYLGATGSVPVYELANAIDRGDVATALETLQRLLETPSKRDGKPMHPLQVLAVLHSHYRRLLRVDDPSITGEKDAHAALGGKGSPYGSKKAWQQATSLGTDGLRAAYDLLARADLDIKGESGADPQTVIELLVARLTGLSRSRPGARRR